MNVIQKRSWYCLSVFALFLIVPAIVFPLFGWITAGWAAMGISFLVFLTPLLFPAKEGKHEYDDLAETIRTNAFYHGAYCSMLLVIMLCFSSWLFFNSRGQGTINVDFLLLLVVLMAVCFNVTYAVSILSQFRRKGC